MALQLEKIFLGTTQTDQRNYLSELFRFLRSEKGFEEVHVPAAGQFSIVKAALEAGFEPSKIFASDISLYSSLLGYLFAGHDIDSLEFEISEEYRPRYDECKTDSEKVAYIFWIMKTKQLREAQLYEAMFLGEISTNREVYIKSLAEALSKTKEKYKGINYMVADLRDVIRDAGPNPKAIVALNPPVFKGGYEKMFDFKGALEFDPNLQEFDWKKEYDNLYAESKELNAFYVWYRVKSTEGYPSNEVIYAKQQKIAEFDYWLATKPDLLKDFKYYQAIVYKNPKLFGVNKLKMLPKDYEITEKSEIGFKSVEADVALYFRDLWAHKLGNTKAEHYYLMTVDGYVFATTGMMTGKMFKMQTDYVFENYGFNAPLDKYPRANRLLMLAITSADFGKIIRKSTSKVNRTYVCNGLRTTCLSKYRKVKLNNGILDVIARDKQPNGLYKILYHINFRQDTFADVIKRFITEEQAFAKQREEARNGQANAESN